MVLSPSQLQTIRENPYKADFPLLAANPGLAYLDSAATSQRPRCVLDAQMRFYETMNANALRGLYRLSVEATAAIDAARASVAHFIGAADPAEVIFTRNTSESLNLVARSLGRLLLQPGDEVVISIMEHHSNLIPWQQICAEQGATLTYLYLDSGYRIPAEELAKIGPRTRIVSVTQVSNVLGVENDIAGIAARAHAAGAVMVVDGAQSVPHVPVDVEALGCDFLAFSGHKMLGPMGIGALYGRKELLEQLPPFLFGGEMIEFVTREDATWAELPHKYEAGTVNAGDAVGLKAAIEYYQKIGFENIVKREEALGELAFATMKKVPYLTILGADDAASHHGIFAFTLEGVHPHDIAQILSADGVCVRAGHHCAQPLMAKLGVPASGRVSLAFYNTEEEIAKLGECLCQIRRKMGYAE